MQSRSMNRAIILLAATVLGLPATAASAQTLIVENLGLSA